FHPADPWAAPPDAPGAYAPPPPPAAAGPAYPARPPGYAAQQPPGDPPAGWGWAPAAGATGVRGPPARGRGSGGGLAGILAAARPVGGAAGGVAGYLAGRENISFGPAVDLDDTTPPAVTRPPDSVAGIAARVLPGVVKIEVRGSGSTG